MHAALTGSCDCHMTRRIMVHRSRFHVCVHGIALLATLRDALKKQAEERALDVEEAAEKGSSVGLDQICFFFLPILLFYHTHFASYFNLKLQHYYVIKLPKIHQTKKTMNVKHKW